MEGKSSQLLGTEGHAQTDSTDIKIYISRAYCHTHTHTHTHLCFKRA